MRKYTESIYTHYIYTYYTVYYTELYIHLDDCNQLKHILYNRSYNELEKHNGLKIAGTMRFTILKSLKGKKVFFQK